MKFPDSQQLQSRFYADGFKIHGLLNTDCKSVPAVSISETDSTLGFQQFKNIESVEIFPNPNDGRFKVTVKLLKLANMDVKIIKSATGQVVLTKKDTGFKIYTFEVYLSVPADFYVLTVVSNQSIFTKLNSHC